MKTHKTSLKAGLLGFPISILSLAIASSVSAQTASDAVETGASNSAEVSLKIENPIEEVVILGRLQGAAQQLVDERIESDVVIDLLGAEQISRVGDTNVADALRRVPGLTLVDGKFIYIRGLGERYTNVTLNGATVPSPDLTRNVLPLDIFPTSIVESLSVQKAYSSDRAATFAGGSINIRTTAIPEDFVAYLEAGGGINSDSDEYLDYPGGQDFGSDDGSRSLPNSIRRTLSNTFQDGGNFELSANAIRDTAARNGNPVTEEEADALNRQLALDLNRNLDIASRDSSLQDFSYGAGIGNSFDIGTDLVLGVLGTVNYGESIRTQERIVRKLEEPDEEFTEQTKSTQNASLTATFGASVAWGIDHSIETKNFFIRNTDDEAFIRNRYDDTAGFSDGRGFREFEGIFEEREVEIYQFLGSHVLGSETLERLGLNESFLSGLELNWFYSESSATTEIPNAFSTIASFDRDINTNVISNVNLTLGGNVSNGLLFQNTSLEDELESSGFEIKLPVLAGDWEFEFSGGVRTDRRARISNQLNFTIDADSRVNSQATGLISERFSDEAINDVFNNFQLNLQNTDFSPAIAATQVDATFGQVNVSWNETLSAVIGVRYEDYRQVGVEFNPLGRVTGRLPNLDPNDFSEDSAPEGIFINDDFYPSASFKYETYGFGADTFNLHLSWSETTVRPDLREITNTSYRDPVTDFIITGNSSVVPSDVTNIDLRAEWYFSQGDNLSVSLFTKDIDNPIDIFPVAATGSEQRGEVLNGKKADVAGVEIEWLLNLGFIGSVSEQFFVSGNYTYLFENELDAGNVEGDFTNRQRPLSQASDYVVNVVLGFDSYDGKHSAGLAFNTFGERLYIPGVSGFQDSFEQPVESLDMTYTYFVTDNFKVRLKAKNILDADNKYSQIDDIGEQVTTFEQAVGQSYSLGLNYNF